ncbi:hypothetical protein OSTOST_09672 [Ostertagia ostertagi]
MKYLVLLCCLGVVLACYIKVPHKGGDLTERMDEGESWIVANMFYECKDGKLITTGCGTPKGNRLKVGETSDEGKCTEHGLKK